MATPAILLPFDEFKDMRVSEAASRLDVDLQGLWSVLLQLSTVFGRGPAHPLLPQDASSARAPSLPVLPLPGAPALSASPPVIPLSLLPPPAPPSTSSLSPPTASLPPSSPADSAGGGGGASSSASVEDRLAQQLSGLWLSSVEDVSPASLRSRIDVLESHVEFCKQRLVEVEPSDELLVKSLPQRAVESKRKATYTEAVLEWRETGVKTLSDEVVKDSAAGAVAYLGPLTASLAHYDEQIRETTDAVARCDKSTNLRLSSRLNKRLVDLKEGAAAKKKELDDALKHLQETTWASAQALASRLDADRRHYASAMELMAAADPGVLEQINALAAVLHNVGPLKAGEEAQVIENGQLERVRIERALGDDEYVVAFWNTVDFMNTKFEEGFDTTLNRRIGTLKRRDIYADKKQRQTISNNLLSAVGVAAGELSIKSPTFLMLMYADAEASLERLRQFCLTLEEQIPGATAIVPTNLKKIARVSAKVLDKYCGDFSKITDIARGTMKCPSLAILLEVLKKVGGEDAAFRLVLIKNRLMPEYNADEAGGYRDMLLNLVDTESGHVVELQLTMTPLLEVKMHGAGGHVAYNVARMLNLFDESVNVHNGALTENVFKGIESGLLRVLDCGGQATALGAKFDRLLSATKSKYCGLVKVRLDDVGWPANREISELLEALWTYGGDRLEYLWINDAAITGKVPETLFDRLPRLRTVRLPQTTALAGPIPPSLANAMLLEECIANSMALTGEPLPLIGTLQHLWRLDLCLNQLSGCLHLEFGKLQNLKILSLHTNKFHGTIPSELSQLQKLQCLDLNSNHLTGSIPIELGQLLNLETLCLNSNRLTGAIPSELGQLQKLQSLHLHENQLVGSIPSELGKLRNIKTLALSSNRLTGTFPPELSELPISAKVWLGGNPELSAVVPPELEEARKKGLQLYL